MEKFKDTWSIVEYLNAHNYLEVKALGPNRISFKENSGDGSWEGSLSEGNDWVRQELGTCCLDSRKEISERAQKLGIEYEQNYCNECGTGINGTATYLREKNPLEDEINGRSRSFTDENGNLRVIKHDKPLRFFKDENGRLRIE